MCGEEEAANTVLVSFSYICSYRGLDFEPISRPECSLMQWQKARNTVYTDITSATGAGVCCDAFRTSGAMAEFRRAVVIEYKHASHSSGNKR